jgi:predicted 3-demethylubiquinone-9 3-methyltransferase (glyoxalase superfamily)
MTNHPIYPCLWFDGNASEAAEFYLDTFGKGAVTAHNQLVTTITLSGEPFMLLNGGPMFRPNPSISFYVVCETIEEVNNIWEKLAASGNVLMPLGTYPWSERYGWVQDQFGVWSILAARFREDGRRRSEILSLAAFLW